MLRVSKRFQHHDDLTRLYQVLDAFLMIRCALQVSADLLYFQVKEAACLDAFFGHYWLMYAYCGEVELSGDGGVDW